MYAHKLRFISASTHIRFYTLSHFAPYLPSYLPLPPPLPPRTLNRLRQGFYGPVHPAQPAFVSPPVPDIWQCVEATWRQPLRTKPPIAAMAGIIRVQGRSDTACPGVPPLDESLAAHLLPQAAGWAEGKKPLTPLPQNRDTLEYLDKMFRLGAQMAAAANNLGVLGVSLFTPQTDTPPSRLRTGAIIRTAALVR